MGRRAEALSLILKKGMKIFVEGKMQTRTWESNAGEQKSRLNVIAKEIILLDKKTED